MSEIKINNAQNQSSEVKKDLIAPLTFLAAPFQFVGSLTLGVCLLAALLVLMAWGTFIESEYGSAVARFVLYGNLWFAGLVALLALNIAFSLLCHFPGSRRKIPFVTAHAGILVLLFGCYLTFQFGEEAQMTLPEGTIGCVAIKPEQQQFELQYVPHSLTGDAKPLHLPFRPGPFSWQDYQWENWVKNSKGFKTILWHAMRFGKRDIGELPSGDSSIKIEVLDYLAHSALEPVPPFDVSILWQKTVQIVSELGEVREVPRNWESLRLELRQAVAGFHDVRGSSAMMSQGERVSYTLATSQEELTAFRMSRPKGGEHAGLWGELVLYYGGTHYSVNVGQLLELTGNNRLTVKGSGLEIGNVIFRDRGPIISFSVFTQNGKKDAMTLFPDNPELNMHARELGIFGSYWIDPQRVLQQSVAHAEHPILQRLILPRLDFMQGPDRKLYYRFWSGQKIIADGIVPDREGQKKSQFTLALPSSDQAEADVAETNGVEIVIDRFMPQDVPGCRVVPVPAGMRRQSEQRVKLCIKFDGKEDTFWLRAVAPTVVPLPPDQDQIRYIYGKDRTLSVKLNFENIVLGFGILLKKFEKRTEPGTRMPSYYSSLVDYVEPIDRANVGVSYSRALEDYRTLPGGENVLISMNRPGYFAGTGRGYRIYQASYKGPYYPDQPDEFRTLYDGTIFPWETRPRESIAMSQLSLNADPGRGWKYFGSFLIVIGIALFVWRKH